MVQTTPVYGLHYRELTDAPDIPAATQTLAQDVESKFVTVDSDLTARARGVVKWGQRTTATGTTTSADLGVLRVDGVSLLSGRQYRIWTTPLHMRTTSANDEVRCRLRFNIAGTATTASTVLPGSTVHARLADINVSEDRSISTTYTPAGNETMSVLLCVGRIATAGNASLSNSDGDNTVQLVVEDIGLAVSNSGVVL